MRFLLVFLGAFAGGSAQAQTFEVTNKVPAFTVTNRMPVVAPPSDPPKPRREYWQGFGWVEWRDGGWWKVDAAPEVPATARPFPVTPGSGPGTPAPNAVGEFSSRPAPVPFRALTGTSAPWTTRGGTTNCPPFG